MKSYATNLSEFPVLPWVAALGMILLAAPSCAPTDDAEEDAGTATDTTGMPPATGTGTTGPDETESGGVETDGPATDSTTTMPPTSGSSSESGAESSESGGPPPPMGDGPGPSSDPQPEAAEPGEYVCDGCPEAMTDLEPGDAGVEPSFVISGTAAGDDGEGQFIVIAPDGRFSGGMLATDPDSGAFEQEIPLFCGENLVKMFLTNDAGTSAFVRSIEHSGCVQSDVRATVAWDNTVQDFGLHLVRFGGTIADVDTDCSNDIWCTGDLPDWGMEGSPADNPILDVDGGGAFASLVNISYPGAEDGLTLMVENYDVDGGLVPAGTVYINTLGAPTLVLQIASLAYQEVITVASIDGAAGTAELINELNDCSGDWIKNRCRAPDLP